jgi:hypothetical protein
VITIDGTAPGSTQGYYRRKLAAGKTDGRDALPERRLSDAVYRQPGADSQEGS